MSNAARQMILVVAAAILLSPIGLRAQRSLEAEVKAAFIYNFVSFTEWPSSAFPSESSPLRLCVFRNDQFADQLQTTVIGEAVQGHALTVDRVTTDADARRCHLLFIPSQESSHAAAVLHSLGSAPVLTVGESDFFLHEGGIVSFAVEDGHVRFDVSQRTARGHGLTLSSRMLHVARSVR